MRFLVDTDWVIHYLNGNEGVRQRLDGFRADGIGVSVITLAEVYHGVFQARDSEAEEREFEQFLRGFEILGVTETICKLFGRERGRLKESGRSIGDFDLLIGCAASVYGLTLLTNNRRHFERIADLAIESV